MRKRLFVSSVLVLLIVQACENSGTIIDDERIIGVWNQVAVIENGIEQSPQDSTIYSFSPDGVMQIKVFPAQAAAPPNQVFSYQLSENILSYWNFDLNVSEALPVSLSATTLRITKYNNTVFEFEKIY